MATTPMVPKQRQLPSKEAHLFKSVLQWYELKQYRKGLKNADAILKKFPEHGETLAMKGLFLQCLDRRDEGYDCVRRGLRSDLTSHICWHVFGLMHRADRNYEEAIKCYRNALKYDPKNYQILRDMAILQVQMRQYDAYIDSRIQMLRMQPVQPMHWAGLAVAYYLAGMPKQCIDLVDRFTENITTKPTPERPDWMFSEMILLKNVCLTQPVSGVDAAALDGDENAHVPDPILALSNLTQEKPIITDPDFVVERRTELLMSMGRVDEAKTMLWQRLLVNPDSRDVLEAYLACVVRGSALNATAPAWMEPERADVVRECEVIRGKLPKSSLPLWYALAHAPLSDFERLAQDYLRAGLRRGVPSLFVSLKALYPTPLHTRERVGPHPQSAAADAEAHERVRIIERVVLTFEANLSKFKSFEASETGAAENDPGTALIWTQHFLSQHYDRRQDLVKAREYIDKALSSTDAASSMRLDLLRIQAKIVKHTGDVHAAWRILESARELDASDRWICNKSAKYALRCGHTDEASALVGRFTRAGVEPCKDLLDMQAMWYFCELADAHRRAGHLGHALRWYHAVEKIFREFIDDQLDFHTYCLRKATLRSYADFIKFEDRIRDHPFFIHAAVNAIECYIQLHQQRTRKTTMNADTVSLNAAELKKLKSKQRKADKRANETPKPATKTAQPNGDAKGGAAVKAGPSEEELAEKHLNVTDPLSEAGKLLVTLEQFAPSHPRMLRVSFDLFLSQGKYLLALKRIVAMKAAAPNSANAVFALIRLQHALSTAKLDPPQKAACDACITELTHDTNVLEFATAQREAHPGSAPHLIAVVEAMIRADPTAAGYDRAVAQLDVLNTDAVYAAWKTPTARAMLRADVCSTMAIPSCLHDADLSKL